MLTRREFTAAILGLPAVAALPASALAQGKYPARAIEVVVPFARRRSNRSSEPT